MFTELFMMSRYTLTDSRGLSSTNTTTVSLGYFSRRASPASPDSVSGNNITMNSAYFSSKTNLVYQVVPDYTDDFTYKIITLTGN